MVQQRKKNAHLWERDDLDWYVEPSVCSLALFNSVKFNGTIWDPACGVGRIIKSAKYVGLQSQGTDIIERSVECQKASDFLSSDFSPDGPFSIVTNPPFKLAEEFVHVALGMIPTGSRAAFLLPLVWMAGFSTKRDWLPQSPLRYILPISPRPSMPPGQVIVAGEKPGNGTKDFGWFVWQKGYQGSAEIEFLNTNPYKAAAEDLDAFSGDLTCERRTAA